MIHLTTIYNISHFSYMPFDFILPILIHVCLFTGGRDRRGGPVLTFPADSVYEQTSLSDIASCLSYLITIPR